MRAALLDAYVAAWDGAVSAEAVELARIVTPLHHAVSYSTIVANVERSGQGRARRDARLPARGARARPGLVKWLDVLDAVSLSSNTEVMRPPLPLLALVLALAAATSAFAGGGGAANEPLLGIAGQPDRFERQTGQESQIRQIFLGWGQGSTWGSPFAQLFAGLRPIPMIHIGTDQGRARAEAITPAQIAAGRGDAYLIALNQAIAAHGGPIYVRVLAEMNNPKNLYAPTRPNGTSKGPSHSPPRTSRRFGART